MMGLDGKLVVLREEQSGDAELLTELRNDLATQGWSQTLPPDFTEAMHTKRFEGREFSFDRQDGRFMIVDKASSETIGTIGYSSLQSRWEATVGLMIARKYWGAGVALDTQEIMLEFLFEELGVRVVRLWTHSGNPRAVGLAKKSGFQESYRQRESIFKGGQLLDNLQMDLQNL
jgi:RimJ/RimL family protein N-acetyltransferase